MYWLAPLLLAATFVPAPTPDSELATGVQQVEEGDFEGAVVTLDAVLRRLGNEPERGAERAQAHLHLGIAYVFLDMEKSARGHFREALALDGTLSLDPQEHPPKVLKAFAAATEGMEAGGAAVPTETAATVPPRPTLGLGVVNHHAGFRARYETALQPGTGAGVQEVSTGGPAFEAGIRVGDVVRRFDNTIVESSGHLIRLASEGVVGQTVTLEVWRGGRSREIDVSPVDAVAACRGGAAWACGTTASRYLVEKGTAEDEVRAVEFARPGCQGGDTASCRLLAWAHETGKGVRPDRDHARSLYAQACDERDAYACVRLGALREAQEDYRSALAAYEKACSLASALCGPLGVMHYSGHGVPEDHKKAATLFRRACDWESAFPCGMLGWLHESGAGVRKDLSKAVALYERSCDLGTGAACSDLGERYQEGRGTGKDESKAVAVFERGCQLGSHAACANLGWALYRGRGAAKDSERGLELLSKACEMGITWACEKLGTVRGY
jgi:TPR repeat protein